MLRPDHRYQRAKALAESEDAEISSCRLATLLSSIQKGEAIVETSLSRALEIFSRRGQSRLLMEAMLIAPNGDIGQISESMDVQEDVVKDYKEFFFDTDCFRDKFDICDYISDIEDERERVTKTMALTNGFHYVLSHFSGGDLHMTPLEMCKKIQAGAFRMFQQGVSSLSTSEAAKESKAWAAILKSVTEFMEKHDGGDGAQSDFLSEFRVIFQGEGKIEGINALQGDVVRG